MKYPHPLLHLCFLALLACLCHSTAQAQNLFQKLESDIEWYSTYTNDTLSVQTSYPKGGPYKGDFNSGFNPSYLVFVHRVKNYSNETIELNLSSNSSEISIPNSPNTFMKLLLPEEIMTEEKLHQKSYGLTKIESEVLVNTFRASVGARKSMLFYSVALFYQKQDGAWTHERGGNRAEVQIKGLDVFYSMKPLIEAKLIGRIAFKYEPH